MERSLIYRIILVCAVLLFSALALVPTLFYDYRANKSRLPEWWESSKVLPTNHLVLGLDLQGGMDLVVSVNADEAVVSELRHYHDVMTEIFKDKKIGLTKIEVDAANYRFLVQFPDAASMKQGVDYIRQKFPELQLVSGKDTLSPVYALQESARNHLLRSSVDQVREILARRMDAFGLTEPEIAVQGENRVRLQLPGVTDSERIKKAIQRTAKLDFLLVEAVGMPRAAADKSGKSAGNVLASWADLSGKEPKTVECYFPENAGVKAGPVPADRRLVLGVKKTGETEQDTCYLLNETSAVSGADLKDARPGYDPTQFNAAVVNFEFNMKGAQKFAKVTGDNQGRLLAIVLENAVVSAPVIRSRISSRGQIEGAFTPQEAADLANVLKSGALDVGIKIEEERTVGATLGADSIHQGEMALFWGSLAVVVFMIIYYSLGGVIADMAVLLNVVLIMAALSLFGATLTLPGLAGIILTVGMAVDANVLIFERTREELRGGKTPRAAMEAGYAKALWTILDANITTLIAALVLFQWGTGPIKGFAVTLSLGILSSVFTAVVVTRIIYDLIFFFKKDAPLRVGIKVEPAVGSR